MILGQSHDTPLGHGQLFCEIVSRSTLAVRSYGPDTDFQYMCTLTLTLEIWPWVKVMTHLGLWTTIVWNIIQIQLGSDELWPGHGFPVCVTLTLEIRSWVKVMTRPWVMDNNCVKYYPDPTWQWRVMARTMISNMCALWHWRYHDSPLGNGQQLCEIISRTDMGVRRYGPNTMWIDGQDDSYIPPHSLFARL